MELFKLLGTVAVDIADADTQLDNIITKAERTSSGFGNAFSKVGDVTTKAGQKLMPITLGLGAIATEVVKTTADFDSGMSQVAAISGATGEDFDALRAKAREMGGKTKFSAAEAAEAMNYMAMAGWKTNDMLTSIDGIMNLAAASGESLGTTSDIVTDAMTAFGMAADGTSKVMKDGFEVEVSNATRFADVLAAASSNANTNVSMMGESFKYVAPVAGSLGFSVEDVATALGLMANSGIKASSAGTSLRTLFTNMSNPTDQMAMAMDALGVSLDDGHGNMLSFADVMKQLRAGFGELRIPQEEFTESMNKLDAQLEANEITQKEYDKEVERLTTRAYGAEGAVKAQYAAMLAGKTGMSGLLSIVNATDEDFQKLTDSIYGANGSAEDMANIMQDNLNGQFTILLSQLQELAISFGDMVMPIIRDFVTYIQGLVDKLNQMDEAQREQIIRIAAIVAAAAPLLLVIGKLFGAVGSIIDTTKKLYTFGKLLIPFLGSFGAPMLAIIAVIGLLVAAGVSLYKNWDTIKENAAKLWSSISDTFSKIKNSITEKINSAKDSVHNAIEKIKGFFNFSWSLPKLKLPHFSISGEFSLNPPSIPKIGVDWYAKAMNNPMIMDKPTAFGINNMGQLMAGGEKGSEVVSGTDTLMGMIRQAVSENTSAAEIAEAVRSAVIEGLETIDFSAFIKIEPDDRRLFKVVEKQAKIQKKSTGREVFT